LGFSAVYLYVVAQALKLSPMLMTAHERSDDALCRDLLAGDRDAFVVLVERYQRRIYGLMRRYVRSADEARDLTQQVFLRAFESVRRSLLRRVGLGSFPFAPWLFRLALNLGKSHARRNARFDRVLQLAGAVEPASALSAQESLEQAERHTAMKRALLTLPKRQREVVSLRIDAGLSFAELAAVLNTSEGNARVTFHHALKQLRTVVSEVEAPWTL
jgi:RNA polymerase sigma-70 factor (ECF subfamily)